MDVCIDSLWKVLWFQLIHGLQVNLWLLRCISTWRLYWLFVVGEGSPAGCLDSGKWGFTAVAEETNCSRTRAWRITLCFLQMTNGSVFKVGLLGSFSLSFLCICATLSRLIMNKRAHMYRYFSGASWSAEWRLLSRLVWTLSFRQPLLLLNSSLPRFPLWTGPPI